MAPAAFRPPRWLRSPHLQTVASALAVYAPPKAYAPHEEEDLRIPLPGGGLLHARAWWMPSFSPAVVIVHGIAGSKDSLCCVRAAVALHRAGYHAVRLDMRAAGDSVVDAPSLYHGGLTTDVELTVRHLLQDARVSSVFVLGFSGGGSIALKLAGEWGTAAPPGVTAIASISAPLDYLHVGARMDSRRCFVYRSHVLGGLLDRARTFARLHPERAHYKPEDLASLNRFRTYDAKVIVPMHGFRDVDHYYRSVSSGPYLPRIALPTIVIHAEDDPMVPMRGVELWLKKRSPNVEVATTRHGGHIGWIGGTDEASWIKGWAIRQALTFFDTQRER